MRKHRVHKNKEVMKRILAVMALSFFLVSPKEIRQADAQILIMDDDEYMASSRSVTENPFAYMAPIQDGQYDWVYAPLGDGIVPLLGLGLAYLVGRKRKKDEE